MSQLAVERVPNREFSEELQQIEAQLAGCLGGRVRELRLLLWDGGFVIGGWAPTYYAKQLAQHTLMEISSRPVQANEIEVLQVIQGTSREAMLAGL